MKLNESGFKEKRGILVFGYEHRPTRINLDTAIRCFEAICSEVLGIGLSARCSAEFPSLIHPSHQHGRIYGWELAHRP
jgi:hypothetical protein